MATEATTTKKKKTTRKTRTTSSLSPGTTPHCQEKKVQSPLPPSPGEYIVNLSSNTARELKNLESYVYKSNIERTRVISLHCDLNTLEEAEHWALKNLLFSCSTPSMVFKSHYRDMRARSWYCLIRKHMWYNAGARTKTWKVFYKSKYI